MSALKFSLQNPEILRTLGLLFLNVKENQRAHNYLKEALKLEHKDPRTILAIGSLIQD